MDTTKELNLDLNLGDIDDTEDVSLFLTEGGRGMAEYSASTSSDPEEEETLAASCNCITSCGTCNSCTT